MTPRSPNRRAGTFPRTGPAAVERRGRWIEARAMWVAGTRAETIAAFVGVSPAAVYAMSLRRDWPVRHAVRAPIHDWTTGRTMWDAGAPRSVIAAALGVHPRSIPAAAKRLGWPARVGRPRVKHPPAPRKTRAIPAPRVAVRPPRLQTDAPTYPAESSPGKHRCPCGSRLSRLVLVGQLYRHHCLTCVPDIGIAA